MRIEGFLLERQAKVKELWLDLVVKTYPLDSREFFKNKKDRFANPVGVTLSSQIDSLFDALVKGAEDEDYAAILEDFIKIRSVQEFAPSAAIGFILHLKQAVREILAKDIQSQNLYEELLIFETKVDNLLLKAFDLYSQSREKLLQIRADELKRRLYMAFRMTSSNTE
jgi:hypothetical protein